MLTIADIESRLRVYQPQSQRGDHLLNPGMAVSPPYRQAGVLVALLERPEGLSVLFTERTPHLNAHGGQVSFPGGGAEPQDKDIVATALREAQEEIGLPPHHVRVIGQMDEYVTRSGFSVRPVVGHVADIPAWRPDSFEVSRIFDVPLAHILAPGSLSCRQVMFEGGVRSFYACTWQDFHIWGATAGMLKNLTDIIAEDRA